MSELQNQAALQKRVTKPSDDPLASARVLAARTEISGSGQFLKSINNAKTFLEYSEQSLGELNEALVRAKELAIGQSNDASASADSRKAVSNEVGELYQQAIQVGNRKLGDRFLFGGFRTTKPPFDKDGIYRGDGGQMQVVINKDSSVAMNMPGNHAFLGEPLEEPKAGGPHGYKNLNEKLEQALELRGPASLTSAVTADPAHEKAQEADPEAVHTKPDLSDSGSANGVNVFKVLKDLEIGLKTNDKGSIQDSLEQIDAAITQVVLARSQIGARVSSLNAATETLTKDQIDAKTMASNLEDADTFQLVSDINKAEGTMKATLETSGKLIQPSLLDFLR
jgi:flagellar hook-associated protein 3 FlgL